MELRIKKLTIQNFRAVKSLEVEFGEKTVVTGDNGTGKTTIADSFFWGLFGKDSHGDAKSSFKPLDTDSGEEIHNLETSVEMELLAGEAPVTLSRVMSEKWTKHRGKSAPCFEGNETAYMVDGIPKKKGEFDSFVESIIPQEAFKLITDPMAFSSLHWKKQRDILFSVIGKIDETGILTDEISEILKGKTVEERREQLKLAHSRINTKVKEIPVRISELENSLKDSPVKPAGSLTEINKEIEALKSSLVTAPADAKTALAESRTRRAQELSRLAGINCQVMTEWLRDEGGHESIIRTAKTAMDEEARGIVRMRRGMSDLDGGKLDDLRAKWDSLNAQQWKRGECSACGQVLPLVKCQAKEDFELEKAAGLLKISQTGQAATMAINAINQDINRAKAKADKLERQIVVLQSAELNPKPELIQLDPKFDAEIQTLAGLVENLEAGTVEANFEILARVADLEKIVSDFGKYGIQVAAQENTRKRISDLEKEKSVLAAEQEQIEKSLDLLDQFTRRRVELIESQVNSRFGLVRFKLFNALINGGLEDCCEIVVGGVPFGSGLNTGSRINAGLEIIRTLQQHYGMSAPVFVDNSESVTSFILMGCQMVHLVVKSGTGLTVE